MPITFPEISDAEDNTPYIVLMTSSQPSIFTVSTIGVVVDMKAFFDLNLQTDESSTF